MRVFGRAPKQQAELLKQSDVGLHLVHILVRGGAMLRGKLSYHTLHWFTRTIGCPILQENALPNSGIFDTTPFTRYSRGE
jgi:hypothetical protein